MRDIEQEERQQVRHLLVVEDAQGRRSILLEATTYSIGRDVTNSVVLHSKLVSRQHAILLRVTSPETATYSFRIIDGDLQGKRSTNGLIINGHRQYSHDLKHGDVIVFGGDVTAKYYAVSNLSDTEFSKLSETADLSNLLSKTSNPFQTLVPYTEIENISEAALVRLASFPELTPNPILEVDLAGAVTYLNPAAVSLFPDIQKIGQGHPLLQGLSSMVATPQVGQENFFVREVAIDQKVFEQTVHYISQSDLIRSYIADITQRKQAEEQLRQQAQREALINRILQAMRGTMVTAEVLQVTVNLLREALGASYCMIVQTSAQGEIIAHFINESAAGQEPLIAANAVFLNSHRQILAEGTQVFLSRDQENVTPELQSLITEMGIDSILLSPLLYLQDYLGCICLYRCQQTDQHSTLGGNQPWTPDELSLVTTITDQCAIAIHQAQLYQQVQALNMALERQVQERTAQLQQKMQELQRLNLLKDDFLSTVSHELRTPMANIKMAIHMLKQFPAEARQERYLDILAKECTRETDLINNLLDLQRLEAGVTTLGLETLHLHEWLKTVLEPFKARIKQRQQTLRVDCAENLPPLSSDRTALERIISELLNNACKYTPTQGKILLKISATDTPDGKILFKMANQAEIPAAELPRIFNKFYRIPDADPWKQGGTGLGLALVQKLVEQLQGQISVKSQGGWTTFTVELPQRPALMS